MAIASLVALVPALTLVAGPAGAEALEPRTAQVFLPPTGSTSLTVPDGVSEIRAHINGGPGGFGAAGGDDRSFSYFSRGVVATLSVTAGQQLTYIGGGFGGNSTSGGGGGGGSSALLDAQGNPLIIAAGGPGTGTGAGATPEGGLASGPTGGSAGLGGARGGDANGGNGGAGGNGSAANGTGGAGGTGYTNGGAGGAGSGAGGGGAGGYVGGGGGGGGTTVGAPGGGGELYVTPQATNVATNGGGNSNQSYVEFTDSQAPTLTLSSPTLNSYTNGRVDISGSVSTGLGDPRSVQARLLRPDGSRELETSLSVSSAGQFSGSFDVPTNVPVPLPEGLWTLEVKGTDAAGFVGIASRQLTFERTRPTLTAVGQGTAGQVDGRITWWVSPVTATVSATDNFALGDCPDYPKTVQLTTEGLHGLEVDSPCTDAAGNAANFIDGFFPIDLNDPTLTYTVTYSADRTQATIAGRAQDSLSGPKSLAADGVSVPLTLDGQPGKAFTVDVPVPCASSTVALHLTDAAGRDTTVNVPLSRECLVDAPPAVTGTPPAGGVGEPYSFAFSVSGDPTPTVARTAGTLPPGLALSPAGVLSGTPTKAGTYRFTITATNRAGQASKQVTVTVRPRPALRIADASATEGNTGTKVMTFWVSLGRTSTVPISVGWATANGTAVAPGDFTAASGRLSFAPGVTRQPITVQIRGDRVREANEVLNVRLSAPLAARIADGKATGRILNND